MISHVCSLPVLLFLICHVAATGRRPRFEPLPMCPDCVPLEDILAPGIGFDLTTSYATAAIRYHDGTVENLVKVDGGNDYRQSMLRMSDPLSESNCGGYWDYIRCPVSRAKRQWNKLLGRPSTTEVGIIADLLRSLHTAADHRTVLASTKRALLSVPNLPGLSHEDVQDAMEYTGLTMLSTHKHIGDKVSVVSAAFAGSHHGLCEQYEDVDACEDEEAAMPVAHILALSLSQTSFSAAYTYMQSAYRSILEKEATRFDLGLQHLPLGGEGSEEMKALYWSTMRETIIDIGRASRGRLNTLLLTGENANNPDFIRAVKDALRELLPDASTQDISTMLLSEKQDGDEIEPLYLAARGAAEFAKRAQEAPAGCKEPAHCAENRAAQKIFQSDQILLSKGRPQEEL